MTESDKHNGYPNRQSLRLYGYDYSNDGMYFITLCTENRKCCFGEIRNGDMILSSIGRIVNEEWSITAEKRKGMATIHDFVIMPNHFHAIIEINKESRVVLGIKGKLNLDTSPNKEQKLCVPKASLASMIRGFKSSVTKRACLKVWQRNYYEHIIRNQDEYFIISEYINNNTFKWNEDMFNPEKKVITT